MFRYRRRTVWLRKNLFSGCLNVLSKGSLKTEPDKPTPSREAKPLRRATMSKKNQRAYLDDISANKPARKPKPSGNAKGSLKTSKASFSEAKTTPQKRQPENERSPNAQPAKQRVTKAKKLIVRAPNQKIQQRADFLKEQRADLSRQEPERLQKILAASGVGSRHQMEEWIGNGWVQVNGKTAQLGDKVSPDDQVTVKGSAIKLKWADRLPRIILYYKQEGEIVSRDDPQGRVSVFDRLPQAASSRWVAIGRLDINTSGLLILTTSGELVQRFAHPKFEVQREYAVRVLGEVSREQMQQLTQGIMLEDGLAQVERISEQGGEGANKWYNVVIKEGRNREVRRIFEHIGLTVSRLVRVGFGPIGLPNRLKRGQFYELNPAEVAAILKWADMALPNSGKRRR